MNLLWRTPENKIRDVARAAVALWGAITWAGLVVALWGGRAAVAPTVASRVALWGGMSRAGLVVALWGGMSRAGLVVALWGGMSRHNRWAGCRRAMARAVVVAQTGAMSRAHRDGRFA